MKNPAFRFSFSDLPLWVNGLALVASAMLVTTAFYPFGYDQAVFSLGGEIVMKGSIPYRDFLDTKPPLIFYLYGVAIWVFGRHEWAIHLFDIIFQLASAFYFFRILRRDLSIEISIIAVSLTIILYAGSGFWMTAEAESFALLPSLLLADMTMRAIMNHPASPTMPPSFLWRGRSFYFGLVAGIAAFALIILKFTFVFGAVAAMLFILLQRSIPARRKLAYVAGLLLSATILILAGVYLMNTIGALQPFLQSLGWLSNYASIVTVPLIELIFIVFPQKIVYSASASLVILGLWGSIAYVKNLNSDKASNPLLQLLSLTFIFQLIGVLVERKIEFPYQYTRALWAFTPLMTIGLIRFALVIAGYCNSKKIGKIVILVFLIAAAICFSPLVRIFSQTIPWTAIAISGQNAGAEVERRIPGYFASEQHSVAAYLSDRMSSSDQFFFWGNDVGIYFYANKLSQTICLTATPFRTSFTPPVWKDKLLRQLTIAPPKYVVVEHGDAQPYITGSKLDSYESLEEWKDLAGWLSANYTFDTTIGHFLIFRQR